MAALAVPHAAQSAPAWEMRSAVHAYRRQCHHDTSMIATMVMLMMMMLRLLTMLGVMMMMKLRLMTMMVMMMLLTLVALFCMDAAPRPSLRHAR